MIKRRRDQFRMLSAHKTSARTCEIVVTKPRRFKILRPPAHRGCDAPSLDSECICASPWHALARLNQESYSRIGQALHQGTGEPLSAKPNQDCSPGKP